MPRLPFGRILLIAPLALLAASAAARDISLVSTGKSADFAVLGNGEFSLCADQSTFVVQSTAPQTAPFTNACFGLTRIAGKTEAVLAYKDTPSRNTLSLGLNVASYKTVNGVVTATGTWRYTSGQGDYDGMVAETSTGSWTFTWNTATGETSMDFRGTLTPNTPDPVDPPASLAGLALGAPVLLRRRKR